MKASVDFAVKPTAVADRDAIIAVLVAAFENDPVCRWFFPSSLGYHALFPKIIDALGGRAFAHGGVYHADGFTGAALWLPPGIEPDGPAIDAVVQKGVPVERQAIAFSVFEQMGRAHPEGAHWYLPFVGVLPIWQGRGVGSALLEASRVRCDAEGLPAYLESTHPRNVPLYQRHGFEVSGEIRAGDCPALIPMIRPARAA